MGSENNNARMGQGTMTNKEIVEYYLESGLIDTCLDCQYAQLGCDYEFKDDFRNDLLLTLYEYPNEKLLDAHLNKHFNALVSRIIINNIYSKTSPYYTAYKKFRDRACELITDELKDTLGDD